MNGKILFKRIYYMVTGLHLLSTILFEYINSKREINELFVSLHILTTEREQ